MQALDKDAATRAVAVQRGDEAAGDTLRSSLAEVIVQTLSNPVLQAPRRALETSQVEYTHIRLLVFSARTKRPVRSFVRSFGRTTPTPTSRARLSWRDARHRSLKAKMSPASPQATRNVDFTVLNVKGDQPTADDIQTQLITALEAPAENAAA